MGGYRMLQGIVQKRSTVERDAGQHCMAATAPNFHVASLPFNPHVRPSCVFPVPFPIPFFLICFLLPFRHFLTVSCAFHRASEPNTSAYVYCMQHTTIKAVIFWDYVLSPLIIHVNYLIRDTT